jgi:hypothetical protein
LARCDRPRHSVANLDASQPGGFAQGPEEKNGRAGNVPGLLIVIKLLLTESSRGVGTAWPDVGIREANRFKQAKSMTLSMTFMQQCVPLR